MPRGRPPKQQTLVVPPGADPARFAGTPEAKARMEKARAAKATQAMAKAAEAMDPSNPPRIELNPMVIAVECLGALNDMADVLMQAGIAGPLAKVAVVGLLLKGLELGIGPVESVQGLFYTPEGKIETTAELVRALVLRHRVGRMTPVELDNNHCVLEAVRYGVGGRPDQVIRFRYSLEDAQRSGGLDGMGAESWRRYPRAMVLARVTTEAGRAMFSDVLLGTSFAAGELGGRSLVAASQGQTPEAGEAGAPEPGETDVPEAPPPPTYVPPAGPVPVDPGTLGPAKPPADADEPAPEPAQEPEPATQEPEPEPEPSEKQDVAPAASPVVAPDVGNGKAEPPVRVFSHSFMVPGLNGSLRTIETCGITREQFQAIGDITTPRAGQPEWKVLQSHGRRFLMDLGLSDLKELTEPEATALIEFLVRQGEYVRPVTDHATPVALPSRVIMVETLLRDHGVEHMLPKVLQLMQVTFKVTDIEQIDRPDFNKGLAEIKKLAGDPIVFDMMIEQVLAQQPA